MKSQRERACKECKRLKLKCDKVFPCSNCNKRGCGEFFSVSVSFSISSFNSFSTIPISLYNNLKYLHTSFDLFIDFYATFFAQICSACTHSRVQPTAAICPDGELVTGRGSRFILSGSEQLYEKNCQLTERIRELELALADIAKKERDRDREKAIAAASRQASGGGVNGSGHDGSGTEGGGVQVKKRSRPRSQTLTAAPTASGSASASIGVFEKIDFDDNEPVHPLLTREKVLLKSHIDLVNRPRPGGKFESGETGSGSGSGQAGPSSGMVVSSSSNTGPGDSQVASTSAIPAKAVNIVNAMDGVNRESEIGLDQLLALFTGLSSSPSSISSSSFSNSSALSPILNAVYMRIHSRLRALLPKNLPIIPYSSTSASTSAPRPSRARSHSSAHSHSHSNTPQSSTTPGQSSLPHILPAPSSSQNQLQAQMSMDVLESASNSRARAEYVHHINHIVRKASGVWKNGVSWWIDLFPPLSDVRESFGLYSNMDRYRMAQDQAYRHVNLEELLTTTLVRTLVDVPSPASSPKMGESTTGSNSIISSMSGQYSTATATTLLALALTTYLDTESGFGGSVSDERSRKWACLGEVLNSTSNSFTSAGGSSSLVNDMGDMNENEDIEHVRNLVTRSTVSEN